MSSRELLAYEKRKADAVPTKEKWTAKDWITTSLSVFALVISVITAYYGSIRLVDEIRAVIENNPVINVDFVTSTITLRGDPAFVLINSGTRAAAMLGVVMEFGDTKAQECEGRFVDTDFGPLVLKEKEIVRKSIKLKPDISAGPGAKREDDGSVVLPMPLASYNQKQYEATLCLRFRLATPAQYVAEARVPLGTVRSSSLGASGGSYPIQVKPVVIWKQTGNIFTGD
jgi:hypothetical protein